MDMSALREWVALDDEKKTASALEKKAKRRIAEIEPGILEQLVQEGTPKITVELEAMDVDAEVRKICETAPPNEVPKILREAGLLKESRPAIAKSIFIGRRIWAKPVATGFDDDGEPKATEADWIKACRALEGADFGEFVQERFNIISLSSAMKEEVEQGRIEIPEGEDEVIVFDSIVVSEKPQLNARKVAAR